MSIKDYFLVTEKVAEHPFFLASSFALDWMWPLMARNLIGTLLLCGVWDWILYFSPLKDRLHQFKVIQSLLIQ